MSSVLNSGSAIFRAGKYDYTYDLTTQDGLSNFWDYILSVIPATDYPGMVATYWDGEDNIYIKLPNDSTYRITGAGQIWLHGSVQACIPFSWNYASLCFIDIDYGDIITLKLDYPGTDNIRLKYSVHSKD